jgi:inhibitor of cysteine peptidase
MKKTALMLVLLLALAVLVAGCGKAEAVYGADDTSISVRSGESFTIRLEANPTTGYEWSATIGDEAVLSLEKSDYAADETASGMTGSGGVQSFTFKALKSGDTTVELVYQRSWEPSEDDTRVTYAVKVGG